MNTEFVLNREMGCTRQEFLNWLPAATGYAVLQVDGDLIRLAHAGGEVQIRIAEAPARKLGLLSLPVLAVAIHFIGIAPCERERFLQRFDLYTRRGGG